MSAGGGDLATGKPLGLEAKAELARWPHARLEPLELQQLEIGIADVPLDDASGHAGQLWLGLAAAALLQDQVEPDENDTARAPPSAQQIARAINERRGDPAYDKVVVGYLLGLGELLAEGSAAETATLRQRLAGLVQAMTPETLGLLLGAGTDLEQRRALLLRAAKALPVDAILKLLEAAAASTQQNMSHAVLRILQKLAAHVELGDTSPAFGAEAAVRDTVHQLVTGMSLEDPNPGAYRRLLSLLSRPRTAGVRPREDPEPHSESVRVVQMSLEVETTGIPKDVLTKPGALTMEERRIIERHPVEGARIILADKGRLDMAAVVAYEHHRWLDDRGYPSLRFARDAHYVSRLVHVCDIYDALCTDRPYREALRSAQALDLMGEQVGESLDPELTTAFIRMIREARLERVPVNNPVVSVTG